MESVSHCKARTNAPILKHAKWCESSVDGYFDKLVFLWARLRVA